MSARVLVMTTDTPHHAYFVRQIQEQYETCLLIVESQPPDFDGERLAYDNASRDVEVHRWFGANAPRVRDLAPSVMVKSINSDSAMKVLREADVDLSISFGTEILSRTAVMELPECRLNLHGGDPERYRGLDSHLWSLYHGDASGLVTALHVLAVDVDAGDIVATQQMDMRLIESLEALRAINTEVATDLALSTLRRIDQREALVAHPQRDASRYYSALPGVLLPRCRRMFEKLRAATDA